MLAYSGVTVVVERFVYKPRRRAEAALVAGPDAAQSALCRPHQAHRCVAHIL
jgi:hypothetical protein